MKTVLDWLALVVSIGALTVSYLARRTSQPRIRARCTVMGGQAHLTVTNSGGSNTSVTGLSAYVHVPASNGTARTVKPVRDDRTCGRA